MTANADLSGQVLRLAQLQGGCVARWQLHPLGLSSATITRMLERERWTTVHTGVHRHPDAADNPLGQTWAAVLALRPTRAIDIVEDLVSSGLDPVSAAVRAATREAVVTGWSAAWLLGLIGWAPEVPHILIPSDRHVVRDRIRIIRGTIAPQASGPHDRLRVASGTRMLWDAAQVDRRVRAATVNRLTGLCTAADRRRVLSVDEALAVVDEPVRFGLPRRPPSVLRAAAEQIRPGFSHSHTEALARAVVIERAARLGLVAEPRPYAIRRGGRVIAEADIAVVEIRHDIEIDGPHHDLPAQRVRDAERTEDLASISWTCTRFPVALVDRSERELGQAVDADLQARLDAATTRRVA